VKGSFFDSKLSLNLAAFLEPYKNVQVTIQTPATPPAVGIASVVANAASAQIEGFELEGHASIWGPLSANFSLGLADANFVHTPILAASSIVQFNLVPKWTGNFQLDYVVPQPVFGRRPRCERPGRRIAVKTYMYNVSLPLLDQPAYTVFDANVELDVGRCGVERRAARQEHHRRALSHRRLLPSRRDVRDTQTGFLRRSAHRVVLSSVPLLSWVDRAGLKSSPGRSLSRGDDNLNFLLILSLFEG